MRSTLLLDILGIDECFHTIGSEQIIDRRAEPGDYGGWVDDAHGCAEEVPEGCAW